MNIFLAILSENFELDTQEVDHKVAIEEEAKEEIALNVEKKALGNITRRATKIFEKLDSKFS